MKWLDEPQAHDYDAAAGPKLLVRGSVVGGHPLQAAAGQLIGENTNIPCYLVRWR